MCHPSVQWRLWRAVKHWAAQPRLQAFFQAFMPSHLPPHWAQLCLFVLLDPLLICSSIILVLQNPLLMAHTPPHRLLSPCPMPAPPPLFTPLLGQRSSSTSLMALSALRHSTQFPSFACCLPANRDWWGGTNRCEPWPSSGAYRTGPRSLTSLLRYCCPQQTGRKRKWGMQELKETEIRLLLSRAPQSNEVS